MKKTIKQLRSAAAVLLIFLLTGCYYDELAEETTSPDDVVSFALDIQPIFTNNCASCHPVIVSPPDLSTGNSYSSIANTNYIVANDLEASLLYQRLLGEPNIMPPSGSLPAAQINLVKNWIEQGALNN